MKTSNIKVSIALCLLSAIFISPSSLRGQDEPVLPETPFEYSDMSRLPLHFTDPDYPFGAIAPADNQPGSNMVSDAGATLGRVLFYDKRLSANDTVSCASCHQQENGFSDPLPFSLGFNGGLTGRHSMGLANGRYYDNGRMFWDERAASLEQQVLQPIQDSVEMGMDLTTLEAKLAATSFYPQLFEDAFGDPNINSFRIGRALAQFVRSLISYESKFDEALQAGNYPNPDFQAVFTPSELRGLALYQPTPGGGRSLRCDVCHGTATQTMGRAGEPGGPPPGPFAVNNGLDLDTSADQGAGNGRFKSNSLRNIEVTAPYMHDGRFQTLEEVVEFYNSGIQNHPNLAPQLRVNGNGPPIRFNMTQQEKDDLVAFLKTLTDHEFLQRDEFSDPFPTLVSPDSFTVSDGSLRGGDLADLQESDNVKVTVQGAFTPVASITVQSVSPVEDPRYFAFQSEASTRSPQAIQQIFLYDYDAGEFELVDEQSANTLADKVVLIEGTGDLSRFVEPGTRIVEAKIVIRRTTLTRGMFGFFDRAIWLIR
ncbi:MAG: cytochrome c peroxidase [Planctomycetota bacterium]